MESVRSLLTAARFADTLGQKLWAEAAKFATDVENQLLSIKNKISPFKAFKLEMAKPENYKQFGEVDIVKFTPNIKSKLKNRGTPVIYLNRAEAHAADVCRVLKLDTKKPIVTRDLTWLNQTFGEFKGD